MRWLLQALELVERFPQLHGRAKYGVRIADDVHESRIGKQLEQHLDRARVRRRLEHDPLWTLERDALQEPLQPGLPAAQLLGRKAFERQ